MKKSMAARGTASAALVLATTACGSGPAADVLVRHYL